VTDVRSSEQVARPRVACRRTTSVGRQRRPVRWQRLRCGRVSGYTNTEIGQVITLAYLQAYTDIVGQLGGLTDNASAANVKQAFT
jgi:hypothetical protein